MIDLTIPQFELGHIGITIGVIQKTTPPEIQNILRRHCECDWGDLGEEDKESNNIALIEGTRLVSSYHVSGEKIYITTEADRSLTLIQLAEEY